METSVSKARELNDTGMWPVEYRCVVKVEPVKRRTSGGVELPDEFVEREQMSVVEATLVAVGGNAFEGWQQPIPQIGQKVVINKYAGIVRKADQEESRRLINDKDILAILDE